jgi:hypothetical protein
MASSVLAPHAALPSEALTWSTRCARPCGSVRSSPPSAGAGAHASLLQVHKCGRALTTSSKRSLHGWRSFGQCAVGEHEQHRLALAELHNVLPERLHAKSLGRHRPCCCNDCCAGAGAVYRRREPGRTWGAGSGLHLTAPDCATQSACPAGRGRPRWTMAPSRLAAPAQLSKWRSVATPRPGKRASGSASSS